MTTSIVKIAMWNTTWGGYNMTTDCRCWKGKVCNNILIKKKELPQMAKSEDPEQKMVEAIVEQMIERIMAKGKTREEAEKILNEIF
ncbi:hypothetical protein SPSYN_02950 [Sporotomaculum syntrophicum]|uniref:Uncharacterized protein n=1 Tax=Sporotomaculum syntrophicum TaxID=182264 RepID=A0A9D2WMQ3_9FIRM|nr:hypothetical protein SPSYN_02950 [Sporotomaculum syntrophicum]